MDTFMDIFLPRYDGNVFGCLPFEWNEKRKEITLNKSTLRRFSLQIWTILNIAYICFQAASLTFGSHAMTGGFVGALILSGFSTWFMLRMEPEPDYIPIESINRILSGRGNWTINILLHKNIFSDSQPLLEKTFLAILKAMFLVIEQSYWVLGMGFALTSILLPCKPPFLASYILCQMSELPLIWKLVCGPFLFELELALLRNIHSNIWISPPFGKKFMKSKRSYLGFLVKGYRQLQIQEKIHNSSYRKKILPVSIFSITLVQILSGFAFLALFHDASIFQLSSFLILYVDSFLAGMIIFTWPALLYEKTEDWLNRVKPRPRENMKYFQRVHKSFRPLRLEFGNNFIDKLTPIVIQEFCVRQIWCCWLVYNLERESVNVTTLICCNKVICDTYTY